MKKDEIYMKAAVKNAMKAKGKTGVNPLVGCVIVKNDRIISEGRHNGPGFAHAEIRAINSAFESLKDSTIYITLEPCNTWGKTPPCVETIEQIPFKRIVIGAEDPNPLVRGKSIKRLRKKGYEVTVGVLEDEVNAMNPYFKDYISRKKTYIIIKAALTLDGYLNVNGGESKYFTCEESRTLVHEERFKADAILVGSNTVNTDNPILDCRLTKKRYSPSLIILDFSNKLDYSKNIIVDSKRKKYIFVSEKFKNRIKSEKNIKYFFVKRKESVWKILKNEFYKENIISIYVEGGADVFSGAVKSGLIDEMQLFYAPILSGGGKRIKLPKPAAPGFVLLEYKKIKNDLYARYLCSQD